MMDLTNKVLSFMADKELTPQENLDALIKYAKVDLAGIFPKKKWDEDLWEVGTLPNGHPELVAFIKRDNDRWIKNQLGQPLKGEVLWLPFRNFAKAYLVVMQSDKPTKRQGQRMTALKFLEKAHIHIHGKVNVVSINASVFEHAMSIVKSQRIKPYIVASMLSQIKDFLNKYYLTGACIFWNHGEKRPDNRAYSVGEDRIKWEEERLPHVELFNIMPQLIDKIKKDPESPTYDVLPVYFFMLLSCSPARAHEICYNLPVNCLYKSDNGMLYLRWFPAKGGKPVLKYVYPTMFDWVSEIVETLKKHTEEGRKIAKWYETNPTSLYLPDHLAYLRTKDFITTEEVMTITGKNTKKKYYHMCSKIRILSVAKRCQPGLYRFALLEKALLEYNPLPEGFPYRNPERKLKFSEALMTIPKHAMNYSYQTVPYMFEGINYDQISKKFVTDHKTMNIFERHGYRKEDGSILTVNMHSPRHLIDAIRHWKGVGDKERAQQAGRKNPMQNEHYEHLTANDLINMSLEDGIVKPITALAKRAENKLVNFEEVRTMVSPYLHITEYGFCAHDFAQGPCDKWGDHLLCSEQWYIKGAMSEKERLLKRTLDETERLLEKTIGIDDNGMPVYDRWAENHSLKVERLKNLISLLNDPEVPNGSLIHLNGKDEYSVTTRALNHRLLLSRDSDEDLLKAVNHIRAGVNELDSLQKEEYLPELLRPYLELIDKS